MNFATALLLVKRALGCRIVGHEWDYWSDALPIERHLGYSFEEFRSCGIAACQRHEMFDSKNRRWVETKHRRPGL